MSSIGGGFSTSDHRYDLDKGVRNSRFAQIAGAKGSAKELSLEDLTSVMETYEKGGSNIPKETYFLARELKLSLSFNGNGSYTKNSNNVYAVDQFNSAYSKVFSLTSAEKTTVDGYGDPSADTPAPTPTAPAAGTPTAPTPTAPTPTAPAAGTPAETDAENRFTTLNLLDGTNDSTGLSNQDLENAKNSGDNFIKGFGKFALEKHNQYNTDGGTWTRAEYIKAYIDYANTNPNAQLSTDQQTALNTRFGAAPAAGSPPAATTGQIPTEDQIKAFNSEYEDLDRRGNGNKLLQKADIDNITSTVGMSAAELAVYNKLKTNFSTYDKDSNGYLGGNEFARAYSEANGLDADTLARRFTGSSTLSLPAAGSPPAAGTPAAVAAFQTSFFATARSAGTANDSSVTDTDIDRAILGATDPDAKKVAQFIKDKGGIKAYESGTPDNKLDQSEYAAAYLAYKTDAKNGTVLTSEEVNAINTAAKSATGGAPPVYTGTRAKYLEESESRFNYLQRLADGDPTPEGTISQNDLYVVSNDRTNPKYADVLALVDKLLANKTGSSGFTREQYNPIYSQVFGSAPTA